MLQLSQTQKQIQKLSPAQVQYLKILQLPVMALEQRIKDELEMNPLLEEGTEQEEEQDLLQELLPEEEDPLSTEEAELGSNGKSESQDFVEKDIQEHPEEEYSWQDFIENSDIPTTKKWSDDDEDHEFPTPAMVTLSEKLEDQLRMLYLEDHLYNLGLEIIGNLEEDGYLRRSLEEIVDDVNLTYGYELTLEEAEKVLKAIQKFDPPGIAARDLRECLLIQLDQIEDHTIESLHAKEILQKTFDHFIKKHYDQIEKELHISRERLKNALKFIQNNLNPKPGEGNITSGMNYLTPDFFVTVRDGELVVTLNDRDIPSLRVNYAYKELLKNRARTPETRRARLFVKQKLESARWFIQSIQQRRETMLRVMTTIAHKQQDFFFKGPGHLKPMIYKDIADIVSLDISTISRVVNGKYVQTDFGVYELRYFFSEGIKTDSGEEVSNKEVRRILREIIEKEDPRHPLSDDKLRKMLNDMGFQIARRTVAKYRELEKIPVARLRKSL